MAPSSHPPPSGGDPVGPCRDQCYGQSGLTGRGRGWRCWRGLRGAGIAVDQDGKVLVPGLRRDPGERYPAEGGGGGMSGAQRVGSDPGGIETGVAGAGAEHPGQRVPRQRLEPDPALPAAGEQRAGCIPAQPAPGAEREDWAGVLWAPRATATISPCPSGRSWTDGWRPGCPRLPPGGREGSGRPVRSGASRRRSRAG